MDSKMTQRGGHPGPGSGDVVLVGRIGVHALESMEHALDAIFEADGSVRPGFAVAVNPEKVLLTEREAQLRELIDRATLRYADGIGVVLAMRSKGASVVRIPGCELWERVMARAAAEQVPVFLIGATPETLAAAKARLIARFPGIRIVGSRDGYFSPEEKAELFVEVRESGAKIVTVAMGSPRQERLIDELRRSCPAAFYMGVGGTYDVFAGVVARAPAWARRFNIEWLYRLVSEPKRITRQRHLVRFAARLAFGRL